MLSELARAATGSWPVRSPRTAHANQDALQARNIVQEAVFFPLTYLTLVIEAAELEGETLINRSGLALAVYPRQPLF